MSNPPGQQYKEVTKSVFIKSKTDASNIKDRLAGQVDPITQSGTKFETKPPQLSQTTQQYLKYTLPKDEKPHKTVYHQKSTIFEENQPAVPQRPQKKVISDANKEGLEPKQKTRKLLVPPSCNPLTPGQEPIENQRNHKNNRNRPSDYNGLLQLPDNIKVTPNTHNNPSLNPSQIFSAAGQKPETRKNPYVYDKYTPYKTDHVVGLFNSKVNENVVEPVITPKPNQDHYGTFVNEVRDICYERYQDYY